jgi:hypothetical protein
MTGPKREPEIVYEDKNRMVWEPETKMKVWGVQVLSCYAQCVGEKEPKP